MVSDVGTRAAAQGEWADEPRLRDSRGFATAAALVYAFAGVLLPLVGWCAGIIMVWASSRWPAWRKLVAAVIPMAMTAVVLCAVAVTALLQAAEAGPSTASSYPAAYDVAWAGFVVVEILTACVGLWLLRRAERQDRDASAR